MAASPHQKDLFSSLFSPPQTRTIQHTNDQHNFHTGYLHTLLSLHNVQPSPSEPE